MGIRGKGKELPQAFYLRSDVNVIARDLLGKYLFTNFDGNLTGGRIVEVEAYCGASDKACHAYPNKMTKRTSIMFEHGGLAYVYLIYGIHKLFNIVTNGAGIADAILVRAIEPSHGTSIMERRRNSSVNKKGFSSGPGNVAMALGIDLSHYGASLQGPEIWIEDFGEDDFAIQTTTRIGVDYAGEDALLPWRYYIGGNKHVSKMPKGE